MSSEDMFESSEDIAAESGVAVTGGEDAPPLPDESERSSTERIHSAGSTGEDLSDRERPEDLSDSERPDTGEADEAEERSPTKEAKLFRFPQGRIKQIMKLDPEVNMVNGEAIFLVNKAVEEFIQCLAVESYHNTASSKKKTIMKDHVLTAIESNDELAFLDGAMED